MQQKFDESNPDPNNPFNLLPEQQKIHPAIEYLRELQGQTFTPQLANYLSCFAEPKSINYENFVEGVKRFIELANFNPLGKVSNRKELYGSIYSGLHYNNDLAKLWNTEHLDHESVMALEVTLFTPAGWDSTSQDGYISLIYKGQQPAQALDDLVKGPTVIDCGMFTQLSLWFGIRYMLGNEGFNQHFGRAPFFITQIVYNSIEKSNIPFSGNPLYSFLAKKEMATTPTVVIQYLSNTPLYPFKHPGGSYSGENCVLIDEQYYIFDPHLEHNQGITKATVLNLLRDSFNEGRTPYDMDRLSFYAQTPEEFHPQLFQTFSQLIEKAEKLRDTTYPEEEFSHVIQNPEFELSFDLHKFSIWLQCMENRLQDDSVDYLPRPIDYSLMPTELFDVIPFENRTSMDFSKFKQESSEQKELVLMSKQFCKSVMADESKLLILTGKAGVGKTASAVCAAKELTARGKKVVWISDVMVNGWADQAKSIAELDNCELAIDTLLASDPDVVFLDDDNLAGFSGNLLLEKIYSWFVNNPGKGLFITSNEPIRFTNCYGHKLDRKYYYPPFNEYTSPQYLNWQHKTDLAGMSLRSKRDGQSIGAIVSDLSWKTNEFGLGQVELIPGFDIDELVAIRQSLQRTGSLYCSVYNKLRPVQKRWIFTHQTGGSYTFFFGQYHYEKPYLTANPSKFENTTCKTIALEMREDNSSQDEKKIDSNSIDQLIRVLNYAHDQGERRVILINQTSYSKDQLLIQIKAQLPESESERTWSRLVLLLCETEDSIFSYDQFNGHIEVAPPKSSLLHGLSTDSSTGLMSGGLLFFSNLALKRKRFENDAIFRTTGQDLVLQSIRSKMQLSLFNSNKTAIKLEHNELLNSEASLHKSSDIPRGMFTTLVRKQEKAFLN